MQIPRVIPCLLLRNRGLVKTVQFRKETYIGDPINAVRIYNEMEADELILLDIDATTVDKKYFQDIGENRCITPRIELILLEVNDVARVHFHTYLPY